jgi:prophage regulatory protein
LIVATRFLSFAAVRDRVGKSRSQIWRDERDGKFPKRVQLGPGRVAWVESEVEAWAQARLAAREAGR